MAEVKRPKLISFGCERVNDKNTKELAKTVRISVVLSESTEDSFPEFNYQDELLAVTKKSSKSPVTQTNGLDPFNEDDEDVKRIAAQMEAKYGMGPAKKKKFRKDDFADIGMGYDETDSFIDNTDGYDEIIPKNVTAVYGGFYINCGALEFKTDDAVSSEDSSSSEDEAQSKLNNRKRVLESSGASEDEASATEKSKQPEKKQKLIHGLNGMQKAIKKRLFGHDKIKQIRKRRTSETKKTVRELLKDRRIDLNMTVSEFVESPEKKDTNLLSNENKKSPDSVDNVIESVINAVVKNKNHEPESIKEPTRIINTVDDNLLVLHSPEIDVNGTNITVKSPTEYVQLPDKLPSDIVEIIDSIKIAAASSTEGKVKFFSGNVNTLLLKLEKQSKTLGRRSRNQIYEHLAPFVKCRKETLIKRAKNLIVIEEKKRIKTLLDKLRSVVDATMPSIIKTYEEESILVLQKKFSADDDSNKNIRMPKRHFPWNEDTKKMVKDIVTLRKKCFLNEGKQKESLEQSLITFLKSEVQIIWPEGWMSMNTLMKYSNLTKDRKALDTSKKISPINSTTNVKDSFTSSTSNNISLNSSSGLTITPVIANVNKNSLLEAKPASVMPSETIITRINDNSNISKPLTPPDSQRENNTIKDSSNLTNSLPNPVQEDLEIKCINHIEQSITTEETIEIPDEEQLDISVVEDSIIDINESKENIKIKLNNENLLKQDVVEDVSVIDLTDQPELIRKPGPKSKTKYYPDHSNTDTKPKKESSNQDGEHSGSIAINKTTAHLLSDINKSNHGTPYPADLTINNNSNSLLKNQTYDYSKPKTITNEYNKLKPMNDASNLKSSANVLPHSKMLSNDIVKVKQSVTDTSNSKLPANDLTKSKLITNDVSKNKLSLKDFCKIKSPNELSSIKLPNDSSQTKPCSNDFSKMKLASDLTNVKLISTDTLKTKSSATDLSKPKPQPDDLFKSKSLLNDLSKPKSIQNEISKLKQLPADMSKSKSLLNDMTKPKLSSDYNHSRSISEGDDLQKTMEGLLKLQKMASPGKPKDGSRSSTPVSVINFNKSYPLDPRHNVPSISTSSNSFNSSTPHKNSSFQDAFQKQFIHDFNMMKANLTSPLKANYTSIPKYDHSSHKSNSTSTDRYLQNSNHIFSQQNANNKLNSVSGSSPQSVGSYNSMLDHMYTNFLNEYGHSKAATSKSSTHQK